MANVPGHLQNHDGFHWAGRFEYCIYVQDLMVALLHTTEHGMNTLVRPGLLTPSSLQVSLTWFQMQRKAQRNAEGDHWHFALYWECIALEYLNEDSSNEDSKEVTSRSQCHSMSVTSWPEISFLPAAGLHREVEAEPHQSNNVHYCRKDHRACKELGWEVPAVVTEIKKNLLHTMAMRAPRLHKQIFHQKSKQVVSSQSAGSQVKQRGCTYMSWGLTKDIILSVTFNLGMWIHESLGVLLMAWGLSLFKNFLSNKGIESFTAMTFNSIAKGNLEAILDCHAPLDLKLEAMNKLMSVYATVLLRVPSVTKFHPQNCP